MQLRKKKGQSVPGASDVRGLVEAPDSDITHPRTGATSGSTEPQTAPTEHPETI